MAYRTNYRPEGNLSQRSALFGERSGQVQLQVDPIRGELDTEVNGLRDKVSLLKQVARGIGDEARLQNDLLSQLEDTFTKAGSAIKSSMKKIDKALSESGRWYILHVILFAFFCFFLVFLWTRFK